MGATAAVGDIGSASQDGQPSPREYRSGHKAETVRWSSRTDVSKLADAVVAAPATTALRFVGLSNLPVPLPEDISSPDPSAYHNDRGNRLAAQGRLSEALAAYEWAAQLDPQNAVAHYNRGNLLRRLKRFEAAMAAYDAAIAIRPNYAVAHHNRAITRLHGGDLAGGLNEYEWRVRCPTFEDRRYRLSRRWLGEDIAGKTLFIFPELAAGDILQFCRFAVTAEKRGARVILAAPTSMHALLRSLSPTIELLPEDGEPDAFDYQIPLMSLPLPLGMSLAIVGAEVPYLRPQPDRVARWRAQIGEAGFRIGVAWQGSTAPYAAALQRAYPLAALEQLSSLPGVRLISLQKFNGLDQLDNLPPGMKVETLGEGFDDGPDHFLDTAAAMACCDLFITLDTSVAHLAGATGVTTWVALPHLADWRWLEDRSDSPWYPSATLFRQREPGDWRHVFMQMAQRLVDRERRARADGLFTGAHHELRRVR